jgi:ribosomal protein S18 acetylase RimI-like enzyme
MHQRECTIEDMETIVALWERCGLARPWNNPRDDFAKALQTPTATVIVGEEGSAMVATVMVGFDGHRGWIYYLAVDPPHQGSGRGRTMMNAAELWLKERGAPKLQLMVREENASALGFYDRLGLSRQPVAVFGKRL